ncbi:unnamed protein product [Rhizophagus irregularis]|nr:unnamed protein product [Rhizophagus irregularis]
MASGIAGTILKLKTDFKKAKDECANLVEENKNLKQEIQVLKEKLQEKDKQIEKLQERDEEFEKLQQHVQNLEKQRSEELLQLQELEMISQDFQNELGLSELDETKENDIKVEENNEQQNYDSNNSTTFPSVDQNKENNKQKSSKKSFLYNNSDNFSESMNNEQKSSKESFIYNNSDRFSEILEEVNSNIQAIVGIDFGTTYSGFTCCHASSEEGIYSYDSWSDNVMFGHSSYGRKVTNMKTTTVLYYNHSYGSYDRTHTYGRQDRPVEFFKLYLGDSPDNLIPKLPVEYKKAITDYFTEISEVIIKVVKNRWLQFITESEAAALYCMKYELEEHDLLTTGNSFMVVDCGGYTVDLSTCKLVGNNPLQLDGAVIHGLSISSNLDKLEDNTNSNSSTRVLDYTYGIQFNSDWKNTDPPNRKTSDGKISKFISLVKRGTEVTSDQVFSFNFKPESGQTHIKFEVYYTNEDSAMYIDEPGMKLLGVLNADLPDTHIDNRSIDFGLIFGQNEITAFARNELNGQKFLAHVKIEQFITSEWLYKRVAKTCTFTFLHIYSSDTMKKKFCVGKSVNIIFKVQIFGYLD